MSSVIGKRKRDAVNTAKLAAKKATAPAAPTGHVNGKKSAASSRSQSGAKSKGKEASAAEDYAIQRATPTTSASNPTTLDEAVNVQIVLGSYERVLHGFAATIPSGLLNDQPAPASSEGKDGDGSHSDLQVSFSDTFLFAAHSSSIRCLAVSPSTENDKRILATGGSDERINVYSVSTIPPKPQAKPSALGLAGNSTAENSRNRSLGSLIHHDRAITRIEFPAKGKLFSAAEDNTVAISRTRDWTVLSSIKAPIPTPQGRPSGDTAAPGEVPAGVNDFAIHPSQKLMLSVGKGEKCMRLWNLMTGKKAGVLNFDRDLLAQAGEGKLSTGEGRTILWDMPGENYVVGFERGGIVYGIDSKAKAIIRTPTPTKLHQMKFIPGDSNLLAISTENGSILFIDISPSSDSGDARSLPRCNVLGEVGGKAAGVSGRVKDFGILALPNGSLLVVAGSSDGVVRLWTVSASALEAMQGAQGAENTAGQIAVQIGSLETSKRITCLDAFMLDGAATNAASEDVADEDMENEEPVDSED
ncbi:WD40 repeat-like protein, partial [Polychaeton citri CBS 116435]